MDIFRSDLFDEVPPRLFDVIVINPPYYKKDPQSYSDYAWNCGANGEYFKKLFSQLRNYIHAETKILMVLCDGCDLAMIKEIASENGYNMQLIFSRKNMIEKNFIYSIEVSQ